MTSTTNESREIATYETPPAMVLMPGGRMIEASMDAMVKKIIASGLCPATIKTPEQATVAIWHGMKLGLDVMSALNAIYVVNGRPTLWGDTMLALCQRSPVWDGTRFREWREGEGAAMTALCQVARVGCPEVVGEFSMADAKTAGLEGKSLWKTYPKRMLKARARAFALRDCFADILAGFLAAEEMMDEPLDVVAVEVPKPSGPGPMSRIRATAPPTIPADAPPTIPAAGIAPLPPGVADHVADYAPAEAPVTPPAAPSRDAIMAALRKRLANPCPHPDEWEAWTKWMVAAIFCDAEGEHTDLEPAAVKAALDAVWGAWNDSNKAEDMNWTPVFEAWSDAQARRFAIGKDNLEGREALALAFYGPWMDGWVHHPETPIDMGPVADAAMRGGAA